MTLLETMIDLSLEIKECREEWPDEGRFARWDEALEQIISALKRKVAV